MTRTLDSVGILGTGSCLPEKVLTNFDLEKMVDTSDEWISKRTGISERRILDKDTPAYELGVSAAKKAIEASGLKPEDIDLIINATVTPDYLTPSTACIIQHKIGAVKAGAFDLNAACTGFMYALATAKQFVQTGCYKYVLVIGCDGLSKVTDWEDRNTCVLFADGAGAAVVGPVEEGYGIAGTHMGADGNMGHNLTLPCCSINEADAEKRKHDNKRVIWMDGSEVFKFAVRAIESAANAVLADTGLGINDINLIVPHQANIRIIESAAKRLGVSPDMMFTNLQKYGNMSAASVPVALDEAVRSGRVKRGDNVMLVGFGGGLTWASTIIKWC